MSEQTKGEGEFGVKFNAPTTGEITTRLYAWIAKAGYQDRCRDELIAINRLESQEREIAELTVACETIHQEKQAMIDCHKPNLDKIAALTARAEQAERERDALVKSVDRLVEAWENFKSPALIELVKQWSGQPQDGEGV